MKKQLPTLLLVVLSFFVGRSSNPAITEFDHITLKDGKFRMDLNTRGIMLRNLPDGRKDQQVMWLGFTLQRKPKLKLLIEGKTPSHWREPR